MRRESTLQERLRAWWLNRQGLIARSSPKTIDACVRQSGWMVTAGSTGVYLSIRARMPGVSREAVDRAVLDGLEVLEIPGAHARPWVLVPHDDAAVALRLHLTSSEAHVAAYYRYSGMTEAATKGVAAQICRALDEGPQSSADLRSRITHPDAGELLIGALLHLALRGTVRRLSVDGRLDSGAYVYELRHPDDRPDLDAEGDAASVVAKAARRFLECHGPATLEELTYWRGLTKGAARKALQALGASTISVPGWTDEAWILSEDLAAWRAFDVAANDRVLLLPYRDPLVLTRRPPAILARTPDVPVLDADLERARLSSLSTLHHHTILSGSHLVGVWEYDPESRKVLTRLWQPDVRLQRRVADAAAETARFVQQQLGDLKLSAVDPPARRAKRRAFCVSR